MRKPEVIFVLILTLGLVLLETAHGEIIDSIVAVVNGKPITASDVRRERQILTALGEEAGNDRALLQSLIDRALVEEQIAQFPGLDVSDAEISGRLHQLPNPQGIPTADLHDAISRRILRTKYFNLRFGQFIQAGDDAVRKYYNDVFLPEATRRGINPVPPLESVIEQIRTNVIDEEMARKVQDWLDDLRKRSNIEIFQ